MGKRVLITGGAGFIGSHLCDQLPEKGYNISVLDNLSKQVHGPGGKYPVYLHKDVEFIKGDFLNRQDSKNPLKSFNVVYYLAQTILVIPGNDQPPSFRNDVRGQPEGN